MMSSNDVQILDSLERNVIIKTLTLGVETLVRGVL